MEPKFQSSFIPRGPLQTAGTATRTSMGGGRSILGTIATIVFVISVVLSVGVFVYEKYLLTQIGSMGGQLLEAKTSLQPEVIQKISNLDERIVSTKTLLNDHIILSNLFNYLEEWTLKNLRFNSFQFISSADGYTLSMHGAARGYAAVAQQSEIFSKYPNFKSPIFADLDLDEKGNVTFSFKTFVDPVMLSYKSEVTSGGSNSLTPIAPIVTPVATTTSKQATTTQATTTKPAK